MITPPSTTHSYYTMLLTAEPAKKVVKLLVDACDDIDTALITSLDFNNDVQAMVECQESADRVAALIEKPDAEAKVDWNPIYLPNHVDLFDTVEFDNDGDLHKVAGFDNPFVSATVKYSAPELPEFVSASVCYKQFELPPIKEFLQNDKKVLLS